MSWVVAMVAAYESKVLEAKQEFGQMSTDVAQAIAKCKSIHVLADKLWHHLLRIGHSLVEGAGPHLSKDWMERTGNVESACDFRNRQGNET